MDQSGYRKLRVWQTAFELAKAIYEETNKLPKHELYGLTSQMRRSAVSVAANIAEGYGRNHRKEYLQFLGLANGSLMELETHLLLCEALNYELEHKKLWDLATIEGKQLNALRRSLQTSETVRNPNPDST